MRESLKNLKDQIDHQRDHSPLFFSSTLPEALLSYCTYLTGTSHATEQIATGDAPEWHPNDVLKDHAVLLAYIRVEQLKLQRLMASGAFQQALHNPPSPTLMGGDKFSVTARRSAAGFSGPLTPEEDPELFDESTGPMPDPELDTSSFDEHRLPGGTD